MSYKFDSLITIINKLDGREHVTVQSLMDELETSERTVHRYIKTLQVAGFPIGYERRRQSYAFDEGYSLRRHNLTLEETLSLALAKAMLEGAGAGMSNGLAGIEQKLAVGNSAVPAHIILAAEASTQGHEYLGAIHQAISNFQRIEIDYKALYTDQQALRQVDPYYLFFQDGFWNLRGYCHLREGFRSFALDRILNLRVLDRHFLPKRIDPEGELAGMFGSVVDGETVDVVLRFNPEIKPYILRKKWHKSQENKELPDGSLEVSLRVNGVEGVKQWIYRWLPNVVVVGPKELRDEVLYDLKTTYDEIMKEES